MKNEINPNQMNVSVCVCSVRVPGVNSTGRVLEVYFTGRVLEVYCWYVSTSGVLSLLPD